MKKQTDKLKEGMDEIRADLGNPEITEEERVALKAIMDGMETALMPLAELTDELTEAPLPWWKRTQAYRTYQKLRSRE